MVLGHCLQSGFLCWDWYAEVLHTHPLSLSSHFAGEHLGLSEALAMP